MSWPDDDGGGFMAAMSRCWSCRRPFMFDPDRVPSIPIDGVRQPVCRSCIDRANELRRHNGNPRIDVLPGAYLDDLPDTADDEP